MFVPDTADEHGGAEVEVAHAQFGCAPVPDGEQRVPQLQPQVRHLGAVPHLVRHIEQVSAQHFPRRNSHQHLACFRSIADRGNHLRTLLHTWQTLDNRLDKLHSDLEEDKEALSVLDSALQDGSLSNGLASSVRDVAKVLSETHQVSNRPV